MVMPDNIYEFDYNRVAEDADELYDYANYSDEPEYDDVDNTNQREYNCYYHDVVDELDNE
jgi:hypothetical protein